MNVSLIGGPDYVDEAMLGLGLSYGLTSEHSMLDLYRDKELQERIRKIALKLAHKQGGHNKFLETITMTLDVRAPRYWWQEFDTYRVGVTKQSESTMHTIMTRELVSDDFEGIIDGGLLDLLRGYQLGYNNVDALPEDKQELFMNIKRALPESFLQRRIVCLNAKALQNMYLQRKNHRLPEWRMFFECIEQDLREFADGYFVCQCVFGDAK